MKKSNTNIDKQSLSPEDLFSGMASGRYPHLKIFMSRNCDDHKLPQDFLYIDPYSFFKVKVYDLWYRDNKIFLEIQESTTGAMKEIIVDVKTRPDFLMVKWQDILEMVRSERVSSTSEDQLLDFDY